MSELKLMCKTGGVPFNKMLKQIIFIECPENSRIESI